MSSILHPFPGQRRSWNVDGDTFTVVGRIYEGEYAGQVRIRYTGETRDGNRPTPAGVEAIHTITELATLTFPADEPPAPHDDEHGVMAGEPHGPLAAHLSDRTMEKVLSRPAHVPSIVMLDRAAAAQHLADVVTAALPYMRFGATPETAKIHSNLRTALADYRETTA